MSVAWDISGRGEVYSYLDCNKTANQISAEGTANKILWYIILSFE